MNKQFYELTNPQKSIWLTEQFFTNTTVNNICASGIINEKVNFDLLKQAINLLVEKNDSFRINITIIDGVPMQYFTDFEPFDIEIIDVNTKEEFTQLEQSLVKEKINILNSSRLFNFKLARFPNGISGVILNAHHLISDSWSMGITIQEIIKIYHSLLENKDYENDTYSYLNFINSEIEYKESEKFDRDKAFWNSYLSNIPNPVTIPSLLNNATGNISAAKRASYFIDTTLLKNISNYCNENKISTYVFFMSIFSLYMANLSNVDDVIIGTPILNRSNFKEKNTTGMFVSTIPFRINITDKSFIEFVQSNSLNLMSILRHQKYSYNSIIEDIRNYNSDIPNLYNIAISYQITKAFSSDIGDYETNWTFNNNSLNDMNIHLYDINDTGKLRIDYDYLIDKYSEAEINSHHARIVNMIQQVLNNSSIMTKDIEVVTSEEKDEIINKFNNRTLDCPFDKNIIKLIEEQVKLNPDNIALIYNDNRYTYFELNSIVNKLARYLKDKNICKNDIVGVYMNKTDWFIISILAIQKLGAAYLPMHPEYPEDRVNFILEDSNSKLLISDQPCSTIVKEHINPSDIDLSTFEDSNLNIDFDSNTLCYVIYTSGSTGKPKGVMLTHKNLINFVYNFNDCFNNKFCSNDKCLSVTNISFDVSVSEIYTPLVFGSSLVLYPQNTLTDIPVLYELLEKEHISFLYLPPSLLVDIYNFIKTNNYSFSVNKLLVGVEAIKNSTLNNLLSLNKDLEIVNGYGPTEATICSTFYKYAYNENLSNIVPIGYPIKNNTIFILNKFYNLLPVNYSGLLFISGKNVALGYLNNPENTNKSFIKINKFDNKLFYNTGDNCYWSKEGYLNFIGRSDSQIKFRGHRIELNEINNTIKDIPSVTNSITLLKEINNIPAICSYVSSKDEAISEASLLNELNSILPYYMIPSHIVCLSELPINKNGKIDKASLPEIITSHSKKIKPSTEIQKKLSKIICSLLNIKDISIDDNFFYLGMDSLIAIRFSIEIFNTMNIKISIQDIFKNNTIETLSNYLEIYNSNNEFKIVKQTSQDNIYPLSSAQKRIYYASKMIDDGNLVYNVPGSILINTILDKNKVEKCFKEIIDKQSSYRTSFIIIDNEVKQKIHNSIDFNILTFNNTSKEIKSLVDNFAKPFNLENAPLLRVELHYIDNEKTLLLLDSHHIIMDGTSLEILINEFCTLYNDEHIEDLDIEYKDFAVWENAILNSNEIEYAEQYWLNKFKDSEITSLNLPYDFNMPSSKSYKGKKYSKIIPKKLFNMCSKFANKLNVSPYMLFLSAFLVVLYKYTGQNEIVIGYPTSSRNNSQLQNIIGMFVNNLLLKGNIDSNKSFLELLMNIKEQVLNDLTNEIYPYDLLLDKLDMSSNNSSNSPLEVMFTYQNTGDKKIILNKNEAEIISANTNITKFNLSIEIDPNTRIINIEYRTDLFKELTIKKFFEHYINALNSIIKDENILIKNIDIMSKEEKNMILYEFNNTSMNFPIHKNIVKIFEHNVKENEKGTAVIFENTKLSYSELNNKSNSLARHLIEIGISSDDVIAIVLNRSFNLIISIFATLKAGASYVLIDPDLPNERIDYIISNSKATYAISNMKNNFIEYLNINDFDYDSYSKDNLENIKYTDKLALIYTSGSTGNPKGVLLHQHGFINLIYAFNKEMKISKFKNILGIATVSFDMFAVELFCSLLFGNTLILANEEEQKNSIAMAKLIKNNNVNFFVTTPSRIELLLNDDCFDCLKSVKAFQLGGEKFSSELYRKIRKRTRAKIYNGYGPTEITACCSNKLVDSDKITIGKPISNTQIYICDKDNNLSPICIPGEICVAGYGVANGYLNNYTATCNSFIKNPYGDGYLYKTGDLGKYNYSGEIEYIGRSDFQIKIRGLRIELSEIESKLNSISTINQSVILYKSNCKSPFLIAFVTSDSKINVHAIKKELLSMLPNYMVPRYIVQLDALPITPNGKINRKQLENFDISNIPLYNEDSYEPPTNETEELFCNIWSSILDTEVGINDDLFDIGADSLLAIQFKTQLLKHNIDISYADIFKYRTIKKICESNDIENINFAAGDDYTDINNLLNNQSDDIFEYNNHQNILLLGSTGFIGMHIIDSFIKNSTGKIYCIVREKNKHSSSERFMDLLHFYFNSSLDGYINKRIFIIDGNVLEEHFSLSSEQYDLLAKNIDTVINAAANVKHYDDTENFQNININSLHIAIDFCLKYKKRFIHLSSLSISGNMSLDNDSHIYDNNFYKDSFTENDLFIGQSLNNLYTKSKFEAEKLILNYIIKDNLNAQIIRLGNITSRFSDGLFQINPENNAFTNRLKTFLQLKCFPEYLLNIDNYVEFTPVDICSDAIINILNNNSVNRYIYHVYNNNHVTFTDLQKYFLQLGLNINILSDSDFSDKINNIISQSKDIYLLSGIVNDLNNNRLDYSSQIKIFNTVSNQLLEKNNFYWPNIDIDYIKKYINYLIQIKYINKEE